MGRVVKHLKALAVGVVIAFVAIISPIQTVSALNGVYDAQFYASNHILSYDPRDVSCGTGTTGFTTASNSDTSGSDVKNGNDYLNQPILTDAQVLAIQQNEATYKQAASQSNIPWQMLAAMHLYATGLQLTNPANGQGLYLFPSTSSSTGGSSSSTPSTTYPTGTVSSDDFLAQSIAAAKLIEGDTTNAIALASGDATTIKDTLFTYSGSPALYAQQATTLGYLDPADGSPYVMNMADDKRNPSLHGTPGVDKTVWGQLNTAGTALEYPVTAGYGVYVLYSAIAGVASDGSCSLSSGGMTLEQAQAFMKIYEGIDPNDANGNFKYVKPAAVCHTDTDNCVAFSAYFVQKYTTLRSSFTNGGAFVSDMAIKNKDLPTGKTPQPYAIFSVKQGKTICDDGLPCGHTGVILGIDTANNKVIVGEAAWCNASFTGAKEYSLTTFSDGAYTYAYTSSYLNPDHQGDLK